MESGGTALTMLLEAQVQSRDAAIGVGDAVNGEPPEEGIAAPALTEPVEATLGRVVKWVAAQIRVIATLQLAERAHRLEISGPPLRTADRDGEVAPRGRNGNGGSCRRVCVGLPQADVVPDIAVEVDIVARRRSRAGCWLP